MGEPLRAQAARGQALKNDLQTVLTSALAVVVLLLILGQTLGALKRVGTWEPRASSVLRARQEDPYVQLDRAVARATAATRATPARDPFGFGVAATPIQVRPVRSRPVKPVPPPPPILTAIVWDNDPRALIHWNNRDFTVRTSDLFAEFRVTSITRDHVVLDRSGVTLVLKRPLKGE